MAAKRVLFVSLLLPNGYLYFHIPDMVELDEVYSVTCMCHQVSSVSSLELKTNNASALS